MIKRKTTKELLAESFRELAAEKSVDKITVRDIAKNCGYSTATFYRHFRDKYDLIAWEEAARAARIMDRVGKDGYAWRDTLLDGARSYEQRKEYMANLFLHTTGLDSFVHYMTELNYSELKKVVRQAAGAQPIDETTDMYIRLYCTGTVCLTCDWVLGRYKATAEQLAEIYENSLPQPLRRYLYPE